MVDPSGETRARSSCCSSVPLFSDLEEDELERFSHVAVPRSFPAGDPRLPRGRPLRRLLHRPRRAASGSPASTPTAARSPSPRSAPATSSASWRCSTARSARPASRRSSDGELLALPAGDVRALLARHPEITVKLVAALVRRLRAANERISRQSFQTVPSRVAGVLSQLVAEEAPTAATAAR